MPLNYEFEHLALNVHDKARAEEWYTAHLGFTVARSTPDGPSFLADVSGRIVLELYSRADIARLDFHATQPLTLHVAFHVDDVDASARELIAAGAHIAEARKEVAGDEMIMLRDPFGLAIQLVHRREPLAR